MTDHNRELSIPLSTGHAAINPGKSLRGNILYCFGLVRRKTTFPGLLSLDKAVFPVFLSPLRRRRNIQPPQTTCAWPLPEIWAIISFAQPPVRGDESTWRGDHLAREIRAPNWHGP
jgi:hypothetical protein